MKGLKKSLAVVLAVMTIVLSSAIPAYATTQTGSNKTFGTWTCGTVLKTESGVKKYYSYLTTTNPAKLTLETEYQSYPSGKRYDYFSASSSPYNATNIVRWYTKKQQSTLWSFHDWKSSSGTGMTKYTQLINA